MVLINCLCRSTLKWRAYTNVIDRPRALALSRREKGESSKRRIRPWGNWKRGGKEPLHCYWIVLDTDCPKLACFAYVLLCDWLLLTKWPRLHHPNARLHQQFEWRRSDFQITRINKREFHNRRQNAPVLSRSTTKRLHLLPKLNCIRVKCNHFV